MTLNSEIRLTLKRIGRYLYLTDVHINGNLSYYASYVPHSDLKYILKNTSNEIVGIGTVTPESLFKRNVDFQLSDGSAKVNLISHLWRGKFEIKWDGNSVKLHYFKKNQQIEKSSIKLTMQRKWFGFGNLVLTGSDTDFESFNPTLLIGIFYYVYTSQIEMNTGD